MKLIKDNYFVEIADFKVDRIAEFKRQGWVEQGSEPVSTETKETETPVAETPVAVKPTAPNKRGPKPVS